MSDFAHHLPLDRIRDGERIDIIADESERKAVATRFDLLGIDRLEAHAVLNRDGDRITATGRLKAALTQACVASGEPVPARLDEPFDLVFIAEPGQAEPGSELELGADELDVVFHDGAGIDLGAAIADTLGLALDPYPRSANADAALKAAGVIDESEAGPFAILARLKANPDDA